MAEYGWEEDPVQNDIARARSKLGQLRIWRFPKQKVAEMTKQDFAGSLSYPSLYMLCTDDSKKVYVGQTDDITQRLKSHQDNPPKEIQDWAFAIVINDARSSAQSIFNDATLRLDLEKRVINIINNAAVVNKAKGAPELTVAQQALSERLRQELNYVLVKLGFAKETTVKQINEKEIPVKEMERILIEKGYDCKLGEYEGEINSEKVYIRDGSKKDKGWQVTLRDEFRKAMKDGKGYLLINRGQGWLIPAKVLSNWLGDKLEQSTVDIFLNLHTKELVSAAPIKSLNVANYGIDQITLTKRS